MASKESPTVSNPNVPVRFVPVKAGEVLQVGPVTCRIQEDGSNTGKLGIRFWQYLDVLDSFNR